MRYLLIFQLLCGAFGAFVAGRKKRSRLAWGLIGALLPVAGVAWVMLIPERGAEWNAGPAAGPSPRRRERPKRCCGRFIPDCRGCPYFRRHLFRGDQEGPADGYCEFFDTELTDQTRRTSSA